MQEKNQALREITMTTARFNSTWGTVWWVSSWIVTDTTLVLAIAISEFLMIDFQKEVVPKLFQIILVLVWITGKNLFINSSMIERLISREVLYQIRARATLNSNRFHISSNSFKISSSNRISGILIAQLHLIKITLEVSILRPCTKKMLSKKIKIFNSNPPPWI